MNDVYRLRRIVLMAIVIVSISSAAFGMLVSQKVPTTHSVSPSNVGVGAKAQDALDSLSVKGRSPKTGYARTQFGDGWQTTAGCDTREAILRRDMTKVVLQDDGCNVASGTLADPYTGKIIDFIRGSTTSSLVQIDHVVALSNAWQTGAGQLSTQQRITLANDPLELLAVDGAANQQKSDGDAATWLPSNKAFRCQYVARQIAIKQKYSLWVTAPEAQAIHSILSTCPDQRLLTST